EGTSPTAESTSATARARSPREELVRPPARRAARIKRPENPGAPATATASSALAAAAPVALGRAAHTAEAAATAASSGPAQRGPGVAARRRDGIDRDTVTGASAATTPGCQKQG